MEYKIKTIKKFDKELNKLEVVIQRKFRKFVNIFKTHPESNGLHFELLSGLSEGRFYSGRIDKSVRVIFQRVEDNTILCLRIGKHEKAYRSSPIVGFKGDSFASITVDGIEFEPFHQDKETKEDSPLFGFIDKDILLKIGVSNDKINDIYSIKDYDEFTEAKTNISSRVYEYLSLLLAYNRKEALAFIEEMIADEKNEQRALTFEKNIDSMTMSSEITDLDEYIQLLRKPLEEWRRFLHSSQKELVENVYNGPVKVLGGAGTGKTVVAMHRVCHLAKNYGNDRILYTMSNKYLSSEVSNNLEKLLGKYNDGLKRISIKTLDKLIYEYFFVQGIQICRDNDFSIVNEAMRKVVALKNKNLKPFLYRDIFYVHEFSTVIIPRNYVEQKNRYIDSVRYDKKGEELTVEDKEIVWEVFVEYKNISENGQVMDKYYAKYIYLKELQENRITHEFEHVVVDECQDFDEMDYKILRFLVGTEHQDDIFMVGDPRQGKYYSQINLDDCNICIADRAYTLKLNYRTSAETKRVADFVINHISLGDMNGRVYNPDEDAVSLYSGFEPQIKQCENLTDELKYVSTEIRRLQEYEDARASDICVVTRKDIDGYKNKLDKLGVRTYEIKESTQDGPNYVCISLMNKIKGLEFKYVFIVGVNQKVIPSEGIINDPGTVDPKAVMISERSLMHVAMSRAQINLYITGYGQMSPFLRDVEK